MQKKTNKPKTINQKKVKMFKDSNLLLLYFLGLVLAVSAALPAYAQSNFLNNFVSLKTLSLFFIIANAITVLCVIAFPKTIKSLSNFVTTKITVALFGASLLSLSLVDGPTSAFWSIIFFTVASNLLWINMDILVETFSKNASTGTIRTVYFTFINLGWIISPTLSSRLIELSGYQLIFVVAAFLTVPVFFILSKQKDNLKREAKYHHENFYSVLKNTWKNKNLRGIFFIALLLQIFYNTAVVYLPIYLHQNLGITWGDLGLMFSIMLIPFLIFEIPAGIIADKYLGEKEFLFSGFLILIISLLLFFFVKTTNFWAWAGILFFSRIGASLVEAMRESHFFKLVDAKDISYINLFRTASPVGYIIGPVLAVIILAMLPINYIFLAIALLTLSAFYFIYSIEDTK